MSYLLKAVIQQNPINTPPSKPIKGRENDMIPASGGGNYVFREDDLTVLKRFLILGTESSTMYASAGKLTEASTDNLEKCLNTRPAETINLIKEVSVSGAAIKNDPAIYALSIAAAHTNPATRKLAFEVIPDVCRTGTHFLMFVSFCDKIRGWGAGFKAAVWNWYKQLGDEGKLDYQLAKYRNREGWTHRDVFRLLHKPVEQMDSRTARLIATVVKPELIAPAGSYQELLDVVKDLTSGKELVSILGRYPGATWEMLPTEALNWPEVWEYFVHQGMPITALVRNLNRLTAQGLLKTFSATEKKVISTLNDEVALRKSRIHPLNLLIAKLTYQSGKSVKGSSVWCPEKRITDALEDAFLKSFDYQEPTGLNYVVGLDVSGSMGRGALKEIPGLTPAVVTGCIALSLVKAEENVSVGGFCHQFVDLGIGPRDSIDTAVAKVMKNNFGSTDCAVPVTAALAQQIPVDCFLVMTDNETNSGPAHAANVLAKFRKEVNPKAKMVMAAMTATGKSITDPKDPLSLAIAGFDPGLPRIVQEFAKF